MKENEKDIDLHSLLKNREYDHALIATFAFSPRFFEEYGLERFKALQGNGNLTVFLDRGQYEEITDAVVNGDGWIPKLANRRYLLHPVDVPGVFHPKVFLFTTAKRGLLVIGSANFSQDGLGGNAELVSVFEFILGKNEEALGLFQAALRFFEDLAARWPGREMESNLGDIRGTSLWLSQASLHEPSPALPVFLHNLEDPLWTQITRGLDAVEEVSLVSRFFDSSPGILDRISGGSGAPAFRIYTQPKRGNLDPGWLDHPFAWQGRLSIHLCQYGSGEHSQPLHGKAYVLKTGKEFTLAVGSANFSTAALLQSAAAGNVEAMLLYPPAATAGLDSAGLLDPLGSAFQVTHREQLHHADAESEPVHKAKARDILLHGARLDGATLVVASDSPAVGLACRLCRANTAPDLFTGLSFTRGIARLELPPVWGRRLAETTAVAQLFSRQDGHWQPASNPVLVEALFDPETGRDARQSRRLREAAESPQRFMGVLLELCDGDDETRLFHFLSNCNIPFDASLKVIWEAGRKPFSSTGPPVEFGHLGSRNLRQFENLHQAVLDFARRHRQRLARHVDEGSVKGVPNFLHILETILMLLVSQIGRAKAGLEADEQTVLTSDRWHEIRQNLSTYYQEIDGLVKLVGREYLVSLAVFEKKAKIREAFGDSHESLLRVCSSALGLRNDIARATSERVLVETGPGSRVAAKFLNSLISDEKWPGYCKRLKEAADDLRAFLAA